MCVIFLAIQLNARYRTQQGGQRGDQTTGTSTSTPSPLPTASTCKRQRARVLSSYYTYGVTARLPQQLKNDSGEYSWATDDATAEAISRRAETIADVLQQKRMSAQENLTAAQAKQKKRFDLKHAPPTFGVGDESAEIQPPSRHT